MLSAPDTEVTKDNMNEMVCKAPNTLPWVTQVTRNAIYAAGDVWPSHFIEIWSYSYVFITWIMT